MLYGNSLIFILKMICIISIRRPKRRVLDVRNKGVRKGLIYGDRFWIPYVVHI